VSGTHKLKLAKDADAERGLIPRIIMKEINKKIPIFALLK
jgi:hypothetical protein